MKRDLSLVQQIDYTRALKKFFAEHDLVYSVPCSGTHFLQESLSLTPTMQQPYRGITYVTGQKLYCGVTYDNTGTTTLRSYTQGTIKQSQSLSPYSSESNDRNYRLSFFTKGDFFIWKDQIHMLEHFIHEHIRHNPEVLTQPITFETPGIDTTLKQLTQTDQFCLKTYHSIFTGSGPYTIWQSLHTTTFDNGWRPEQIQHIITKPTNTPFRKKDCDHLHSIYHHIDNLITLFDKTTRQNGSIHEAATLLQTIRNHVRMQWHELHPSIRQFQEREHTIMESHQPIQTIIIPVGGLLHWYVLYQDSISSLRNASTLQETIEAIQGTGSIIHDSARSTQQPGGHCEQRISRSIDHEFSPKNTIIRTQKQGIIRIDHDTIDYTHGIILDGRNNKVTINGKQYSSQQLPSQKSIVEILGILIKQYGRPIKNAQLPPSSYAKNKNNLTGKIIAPLQKIIEQDLGKKLHIQAIGGLYEYELTLPKQHIPITFIKPT